MDGGVVVLPAVVPALPLLTKRPFCIEKVCLNGELTLTGQTAGGDAPSTLRVRVDMGEAPKRGIREIRFRTAR